MSNDANKLLGQTKKVIVETGDGAVTLPSPAHTVEASNGVDLVVSVLTDNNAVNGDDLSTVSTRITTIMAGTRAHGMFTAITVTSGTATCFLVS
jgi:hypothetical protein